MRRAFAAALFAGSLLLASPAMAGEGGEGLYGKTNDKVVTNFGYGVMIFFTLLIWLLWAAKAAPRHEPGPA